MPIFFIAKKLSINICYANCYAKFFIAKRLSLKESNSYFFNKKKLHFDFAQILCIIHSTTSTPTSLCDGVCSSDDGCPNDMVCKIGLEDTVGKCCSSQKKGMCPLSSLISLLATINIFFNCIIFIACCLWVGFCVSLRNQFRSRYISDYYACTVCHST